MAERPKRRVSDMEDNLILEAVKESQCFDCVHNAGLKCEKYGEKPGKYVDADSTSKCPEREIE